MSAEISIPDFVKQASAPQVYGDTVTPAHCYADPTGRKYPFHTKAAAWVSARQFQYDSNTDNVVRSRLETAATFYGISDDLWEQEPLEKTAAEIPYGITMLDAQDNVVNLFPLRNAREIEKAAAYLVKHRDEIRLAERQQLASNILKQAAVEKVTFDTELGADLSRQAGQGECLTEDLVDTLMKRANHLRNSEYAEGLRKMASNTSTRVTPAVRREIAVALDSIDRETGLNRLYGHGIERPEDALFNVTKYAAAQLQSTHIQLTTGAVYKIASLSRLTRDAIEQWLGEDVAEEVCDMTGVNLTKLAEVAPILPKDDAKRFVRCASSCGISES